MVCRSTPGNSAITTMARMQSGVDDVQVLSLFHEIRRDAPRDYPTPTREEVTRFIESNVSHVTYALRDASQARRESILRRFGDAATAPVPDGPTFYAWQQITERSVAAHGALSAHFDHLANRRHGTLAGGWDRAAVENRFRELVEENRRAGRNAPEAPENPAFSTDNIPGDRATRYALAVLHGATPGTRLADIDPLVALDRSWEMARARGNAAATQCDGCGQFAADGHTCPSGGLTSDEALTELRERLTGERRHVGTGRVTATLDPDTGEWVPAPDAPPAATVRRTGLRFTRDGRRVYITRGGQQFSTLEEYRTAALAEARERQREMEERTDALEEDLNEARDYMAEQASRRQSADGEDMPVETAIAVGLGVGTPCPNCGQFRAANHACPDMELNDGDDVAQREAAVHAAAEAAATPVSTEDRARLNARIALRRAEREAAVSAQRQAEARARTRQQDRTRQRTALRTYMAGDTAVAMTNRSQVLSDLREVGIGRAVSIDPVRAQFNEDGSVATVTGSVHATATSARSRRGQDRIAIAATHSGEDTDGEIVRTLRCTCPDYRDRYDCVHIRRTVEGIAATMNSREAVAVPVENAVTAAQNALREDHDAALAAQQNARAEFNATSSGPAYSESMDAFQSAWDEAKARFESGDTTIPYMTENATGGLGARGTGRSFGIEIEVDFPDSITHSEKEAVARELYELGLSRSPQVRGWHWVGRAGGGYTDAPNNWSVEFDRSVDDVGGQRGCEIVSPILYDEPQTWENLAKVCEVVQRHGGRATPRTGLHINVGAADYNHTVENHNRLLSLSQAYEDTLIRMAHNPQSGAQHRGRAYCGPAQVPAGGYRRIRDAQMSNGHRSMVNLDHVPAEGAPITNSTRVEVRIFDGAVDPGRIQTDVKIALGLVNAATRGVEVPETREPAGTHRARNTGANGRARRLRGQEWTDDTASVRRLADTLFTREEDKRQMVHAFAASRWQRG